MKALLDTNVLIHREASVAVRPDIGLLFNWLDRLACEKWIHPASYEELATHQDERVRKSFQAKLASYRLLQAPAPLSTRVTTLSADFDATVNDRRGTAILNEVFESRVDLLISEDRGIARKAHQLGIADRVFTIDGFLEKVTAEHPELVNYKVLSARKTLFGHVDVSDPFFDSFRCDYPGFDRWFNSKSEEPAYVCLQRGTVVAFLYLKLESEREPYGDIVPHFQPKKRLKIGTFKVALNGFHLGERLLKIVFDNALRQRVDEIYVTLFPKALLQERLIQLLEDFGFVLWGQKLNANGAESVYVRDMGPAANRDTPSVTFPFFGRNAPVFLVPIYPHYHTELLPDSILKTESPDDFVENDPHRNAIRKVYVSRSHYRELKAGDVVIFYRTGGLYKSVVTTVGVVERAHLNIPSEEAFIRVCRQRSVFSDQQLREHWRYFPSNRPFVVDFLYAYSFPQRPNLATLIKNGVIADVTSAPRGFERITGDQRDTILGLAGADTRIVVDQADLCGGYLGG